MRDLLHCLRLRIRALAIVWLKPAGVKAGLVSVPGLAASAVIGLWIKVAGAVVLAGAVWWIYATGRDHGWAAARADEDRRIAAARQADRQENARIAEREAERVMRLEKINTELGDENAKLSTTLATFKSGGGCALDDVTLGLLNAARARDRRMLAPGAKR